MITIDPPIEKMTLAERYELMAQLHDSLPPPSPVFSEEHMGLLRERLRASNEGANQTVDYDTAMSRLRSAKA